MLRLQSRICWLLVLLLHGSAAVGWAVVMPLGFPPGHPRFWVNQVLPAGVVAVVVVALLAAWSRRTGVVRAVLLSLAVLWLTGAIAARVVFPVSFQWRFLVFVAAAGVVAVSAFSPAMRAVRWPRFLTPALIVVAALLGGWLPVAQRGAEPSTRPLAIAYPAEPLPPVDRTVATRGFRGLDVTLRSGLVTVQRGRYLAYVQPLLSFTSRSPDRCWTMFAPPGERLAPPRALVGLRPSDEVITADYADADGRSRLNVTDADGTGAQIEVLTELARPIYSHLNTFSEVQFAGHRRLAVRFSPCGEDRVEVNHAEYPVGAPARFAYLHSAAQFRVVEASSGEKGPFRSVASGPMGRADALVITLFDEETAVAEVTLSDWASQASTALSPTAGWRVPVSAIEFGRDNGDPRSVASFFVTLAGTSVGRGFDSVGHAAGVYRNRLRFRWLVPP